MTAEEYFGDYWKCINKQEFNSLIKKIQLLYKTTLVCPDLQNVFKAFELCPYNKLKIIMLGQDPYPQKGIATGLAFANKLGTETLSLSLAVIKEAVINFEIPHNSVIFAPDLEEWAKQGILLLNSSLTVEMNKVGSHTNLWRPFISNFLKNLSLWNPGLIYVLFGRQAQTFKPYISNQNHIIEVGHPSHYARTHTKMPYTVFTDINKLIKSGWNTEIEWYKETKYGE